MVALEDKAFIIKKNNPQSKYVKAAINNSKNITIAHHKILILEKWYLKN